MISKVIHVLVFILLLRSAVSDVKSRTVPVEIPYFLLASGFLQILINPPKAPDALLGMVVLSVILGTAYVLTKGEGIGGGDIKLMAALGFYLGLSGGLYCFFLGGVLACIVQKLVFKASRGFPFVPYLMIGAIVVIVSTK